jgi:CHAT domain-containing protein
VFDFKSEIDRDRPAWQPARYAAFVLPATQPDQVRLVDLGAAASLDRMIEGFLQVLVGEAERASTHPTGGGQSGALSPVGFQVGCALRATLFDPLKAALGGLTRLLIATHGDLCRIPFEALPRDDGGFLIDEYHFTYLSVGRDVLDARVSSSGKPSLPVVIADPDFDLGLGEREGSDGRDHREGDRSLRLFAKLPGTRVEGERVGRLLRVPPWFDGEALESRLKAVHSPEVLHLATHNFFLQEGPSVERGRENVLRRSGLALAGANITLRRGTSPIDDGFLTAEDISGLDLQGTELVVLSACGTGPPEQRTGEGVFALRRALLLAGAQTLVVSLWKVHEVYSWKLLEEFYRGLLLGWTRVEALRQAQLVLRAELPSPSYWGGSICLGKADGLFFTHRPFIEAQDPYVVGLPVEGELFVGRRDVLRMIKENLAPSAGKNILVLRGQRRTGKTSVLKRVRATLRKESAGAYLPILVDLQGLTRAQDEASFFYSLARRFCSELEKQEVHVLPPSEGEFRHDPTTAFELNFLERLTRILGPRQVFLMLDEFEAVQGMIGRGQLHGSFYEFCRHLMQHTPLLFLIAGTQKLRELTGGTYSVFFNLTMPIDIGPLSEQEARWLISEPVQRWYTLAKDAEDEIVRVAGCHPYFTQLVCKKLLDVRNEAQVILVTRDLVAKAVERALLTGEEQIGYPWTEPDCFPEERLALAVLAQEGEGGRLVDVDRVRHALLKGGLTVNFGETFDRLKMRGVVRPAANHELAFAVPLFQRWIAQKGYDTLSAALQYNREQM